MNRPLSINKLLASGPLSPVLAKVHALATLDQQLQALLPLPLQPHCHVMSVDRQTLILAADSPVWAARLRFHVPKLVKQLSRQQTVTQRTVRIRVRPPGKTTTSAVKRPSSRRQGRLGAAALQQAAQTVSDPQLKSALLRLAQR